MIRPGTTRIMIRTDARKARPAPFAHFPDRDEPALLPAVHATTAWRNSSDSVGGWYANETMSVLSRTAATTAARSPSRSTRSRAPGRRGRAARASRPRCGSRPCSYGRIAGRGYISWCDSCAPPPHHAEVQLDQPEHHTHGVVFPAPLGPRTPASQPAGGPGGERASVEGRQRTEPLGRPIEVKHCFPLCSDDGSPGVAATRAQCPCTRCRGNRVRRSVSAGG